MADRKTTIWKRNATFLTFGFLVSCSLVLTATTNHAVGTALNMHAPNCGWIATAAIPSVVVIMILYAVFGSRDALRWPRLESVEKKRLLRISAIWLTIWLSGSFIAAALAGHWINYATGVPLLAAFLLFGPIGEELLFRGVIYGRARAIWPETAGPAMCISTAAFSLHHLTLDAAPHGLVTAQVLFTIPMGFVFALVRERTGSILPGWLLHVTTNLPAAF